MAEDEASAAATTAEDPATAALISKLVSEDSKRAAVHKEAVEAYGPWESLKKGPETFGYRWYPEYEVRFSATISTTAAGLEEVTDLEKSGESRTAESKGSIVIRALKANKKAGKLILTMIPSLKCADLREIAGYFQSRATNPEYQRMEMLNLTGVYLSPKLMRIISDELLNDEKYPYLTWLNLTQTGLKDTPPKKKKRHFEAQLRTQMADAYGTAGPSATASGASHSSSSSSSAAGSTAEESESSVADGLTDACSVLALGLSRNRKLRTLLLDKNPSIGVSGLRSILGALETHPWLFSIRYNQCRMTVALGEVFGQFFAKNSKLKRVFFETCSITDEVLAPMIAGLISGNTHIDLLSIPKNAVSDVGVKDSVCPLLKGDCLCPVTHVDLSSNNLSEESGKLLGSVLTADNTIIRKLDLSFNAMKSSGIRDLCSGLMFNETLMRLRINDCDLDDGCCEALSTLLSVHCNLSELSMASNPRITPEGFRTLSEGIGINKHLNSLNVSNCNPSTIGARALGEAVEQQVHTALRTERACRDTVEATVGALLSEDSDSDAHFPRDLASLVVSYVGFQPMRRLEVQNCYPTQDLPGIRFLTDMNYRLKKDLSHEMALKW